MNSEPLFDLEWLNSVLSYLEERDAPADLVDRLSTFRDEIRSQKLSVLFGEGVKLGLNGEALRKVIDDSFEESFETTDGLVGPSPADGTDQTE